MSNGDLPEQAPKTDESTGPALETSAEPPPLISIPEDSAPAPQSSPELKSLSTPLALGISGSAWLVPGLGHLLLGRWIRSLLFAGSVFTLFTFGLGMEGRLYGWSLDRSPNAQSALIQRLEFFGNAGAGLVYIVSMKMGLGMGNLTSRTYDYGEKFLWVAGLLNYLIALDAFDVAKGRKP
jgi:hypothetical protein